MNIIEKLKQVRDAFIVKDVDFLLLQPEARSRGSDKLPVYPIWYYSPIRGIPRNINISDLRKFAKSTWVQMVTNTIKKTVKQTDWDIIIKESEKQNEDVYKDQIEYVKEFLNHPNRIPDATFNDILDPMLSDLLEIDAGIWYLHKENIDGKKKLIEILPYDASTFLKEQDINGFPVKWWQFSFKNPAASPKGFDVDEICYFQTNNRTYNPYGFSPLQAVQQVVELLIQSTRYNKDFFLNNAIPSIIMSLPNANKESLQKFYDDWMNKFQGKPHKILMHNLINHKIDQISMSNKDMEWLKGQKWYMHLVFGVYGLSPVEAGFYEDALKAGMEGQSRVSVKNAVLPYLNLIEKKINRIIIPAILGEDDLPLQKRTPLQFKYFPRDAAQEKIDQEMQLADVRAKIRSINEVRAERGLPPFDSEYADNPFAFMNNLPFNERGDNVEEAEQKEEVEEDDEEDKRRRGGEKGGVKFIFIDKAKKKPKRQTGIDEWYDVETYGDLIVRMYDHWEKKVLAAVKEIHKSKEPTIIKSFGEFLRTMIMGMTTVEFYNLIKRAVAKTMKKGLESAEEELDTDIGASQVFNTKAEAYAKQQFDGYTLPDGKKWHGIKGVAAEMQKKIYNSIKEGMMKKEGESELKERVQKIFKQAKEGQALRIARTESARFVNEGKLQAYKDSGVKGKKKYVAFLDDRTTEICRGMHGQVREFDEPFNSPDGREIMIPPAHCNCRSYIKFIRE